jgi:class 3 adenylate cyclase
MPHSIEGPQLASRRALQSAALIGVPPIADELAVLLVTDLEGFTKLLVALGDSEACELIHTHDAAIRSCLSAHGGVEIAHLGDGMLAAFRSVRRAIACAVAIQHSLAGIRSGRAERPLAARIGLHAGEPIAEDGRLLGISVNTAFRICGAAAAETILVSDVVRQLAAGSALQFEDRGLIALRGLEQSHRLHQLVWRSSRDSARSRVSEVSAA